MTALDALKQRYEHHVPDLMGVRRRYAVLCPFVEVEGNLHILFEVRSAQLKQGGEVCFPGGRMEAGETAAEAAVRETGEELGIPQEEIHLFGSADLHAAQDGMVLYPLLGEVTAAGLAAMNPSEAEVEETFTVPLEFFLTTKPEVYTNELTPTLPEDFPYEAVGVSRFYSWRGGRVKVPVWYYGGHVIWGLTARVLCDILKIEI